MNKLKCSKFTINELYINQKAAFNVEITQQTINSFAELTGDYSPLHTNEEFARRTQFRGRIAHGMLIYSYASTIVGMYLPGENATILNHSAKYLKPVRIGDKLKITGEIITKNAILGKIDVGIKIFNQKQELVVEGTVAVIVNPTPKKGITMKEIKKNGLNLDFKDKVVLITGASRGIGAACAKLFAFHNAKVVVNYNLGKTDAEDVIKDIKNSGKKAIAVKADVTNQQQVDKMIKQVLSEYSKIDVLINNAMSNALPVEFEKISWDDMQKDIDVCVKGSFNCIKSVLPIMTKNSYGKIINVTTIYSNDTPPAGFTKYVTAKTALLGLTRALAAEYASKNIFFNVISPGFTDTDLGAHIPEWLKTKMAMDVPLKRNAEPLDIAKAILIMASDYTNYVVGNQLLVCGGSVMI